MDISCWWRWNVNRDKLMKKKVKQYTNQVEHWSKPDGETIKGNVDATMFMESDTFGIGWVARDSAGNLIEARTTKRGGPVSPGIAEVIGVREALSWIKQKGWRSIILETDCCGAVHAVCSEVVMLSYYGSIISDCKHLLRELDGVSLVLLDDLLIE